MEWKGYCCARTFRTCLLWSIPADSCGSICLVEHLSAVYTTANIAIRNAEFPVGEIVRMPTTAIVCERRAGSRIGVEIPTLHLASARLTSIKTNLSTYVSFKFFTFLSFQKFFSISFQNDIMMNTCPNYCCFAKCLQSELEYYQLKLVDSFWKINKTNNNSNNSNSNNPNEIVHFCRIEWEFEWLKFDRRLKDGRLIGWNWQFQTVSNCLQKEMQKSVGKGLASWPKNSSIWCIGL